MSTFLVVGIKASIFLLVLALGLGANPEEQRWYLMRRPGLMARSLFSMNIAMPLLASALARGFDLGPPLSIALIALAVSPVPPFLPKKEIGAGGTVAYVFGLLVTASLFSIAFVPAAIWLLSTAFAIPVHIPAAAIAKVVLTTVLLPLAVGMVIRLLRPGFARRAEKPISTLATVLLVVSLLPVLVAVWPTLISFSHTWALVAIALYAVLGHALGHWLGGPEPGNRVVLAMSTASRHPAVAIAIAKIGFPQQKTAVVAVLLVVVVNSVVSALYLALLRRRAAPTSTRRVVGARTPALPFEEDLGTPDELPFREGPRTGDRADRTSGSDEPRRGA